MKKIYLTLIVMLIIGGCKSTPQTNLDEVSLNTAIRQAASHMEMRLDAGTKIALINFTSPSQAFSEYVLDELSSVLVNNGHLVVVDRANLDKTRQELGFNMSGEVSDQSMQEIGQMLGAQALVTGSLTSIADLRRVMFKVIMTETAAVVVQHPADIINDRRVQALLAQGGGSQAVVYGSATSGGTTAQAPAATPAGPKIGTYTFSPRPQATNAGVYIDAYIVKIVVQERYMLIYQTNVSRGTGGRAAPGYWYLSGEGIITDLDNPTRAWTKIRHVDDPDGPNTGEVLSFEGVIATRFSLECNWYGTNIYNEINLANAQYEE
jgi:TolB-like protein